MSDEQRLRDLLRAGGFDTPEPSADLWDRSRAHYRRVRGRRRAAMALAVAAAVLAVAVAVPPLLPGPPEESLAFREGPEQTAAAEAAAQERSDPAAEPSLGPTPCADEAPADPAVFQSIRDLDGDGGLEGIAIVGGGLQVARSNGVVTPLADAGGTITAVGLVDVDGDGLGNLWVRTPGPAGERIVMARLDDCALEFVRNVQGAPYLFDIGELDGALVGMGCVDADDDGELDLVGLSGRLDGPEYVVDRTVVEVAGGRAFVSATDTVRVPAGDRDAVALINSATCGDELLDDLVPGDADHD